jgi:hypothetical protein
MGEHAHIATGVDFQPERPTIQFALLEIVCFYAPHIAPCTNKSEISYPSGCVYVSTNEWQGHDDWLKASVKTILGCQDASKNKVNGAMADKVGDAFSVCVSDGKGCGDCL